VFVELDGFLIFELRVGKQLALNILPGSDLEDGLRRDALVDV